MRTALIFILVLNMFQSCTKQVEQKANLKTDIIIDFSGEYSGTFSDLKNIEGKMEISLYQSKGGLTGGIITLKKNNSEEELITGILNVMGDGNIINGTFIPSVINNIIFSPNENKNDKPVDSYQCHWSFYGEIKGETANLIIGKAVPIRCSESNRLEFTLERNK